LASQTNKEIALANPYIDNVYIYQNQWHRLFPLLKKLRSYNFDFAIELEAKIITRIILMLKVIRPQCILSVSKVEGRYGLDPNGVLPYDYYTNEKLRHQRDTCLDILRLLQIDYHDKSYDIFYLPSHQLKASSFLQSLDSKKIIVGLNVTGSSLEQKISDFDVEKIISGLRLISNNILIILLHKPQDRRLVNGLISKEKSSFVFLSYPTESILDVAALVDLIDLVITPDTSIVHMACAFNKPLIAIYKKDMLSFESWQPKSRFNHVVFSQDFDRLVSINVDEILTKSFELISSHVKKNL
jgi:ADP-heptose:LPS heptosyltransferase